MIIQHRKTLTALVVVIALAAGFAGFAGINTHEGQGVYNHESIRGAQIEIYGKGIYRHMPAEVAPQGIAQDYVTLFIGIPLLLVSFVWYRQGSLRGLYMLTGTFGYFFVTYLFYLAMGMYNPLFLVYVLLLGTTFFGLLLSLLSFDVHKLPHLISNRAPVKFSGTFLMLNAIAIAFMWLGIVVPPLISGSIYPRELFHFTTLIVQGFDLGLLLPLSFVSGFLLFHRKPYGLLSGPVYLVFLSLLMLALTAKIIAMGMIGYPIFPAVLIIPAITLVAIISTVLILLRIEKNQL